MTILTELKRLEAEELKGMSRNEIAHYIVAITQTPICLDKKYCDLVLSVWLTKDCTPHFTFKI